MPATKSWIEKFVVSLAGWLRFSTWNNVDFDEVVVVDLNKISPVTLILACSRIAAGLTIVPRIISIFSLLADGRVGLAIVIAIGTNFALQHFFEKIVGFPLKTEDVLDSRYYATLVMLGWSILRFLFKLFDIVCGNGSHFGGTTMLLSSAFGAGACYSWLLIAITLFAQGILKPASPDFL